MIKHKFGGPVIIYGPQGCGKTIHAKDLAEAFGKKRALEADQKPEGVEYKHGRLRFSNLLNDALYITCQDMLPKDVSPGVTLLRFDYAMQLAGLK